MCYFPEIKNDKSTQFSKISLPVLQFPQFSWNNDVG